MLPLTMEELKKMTRESNKTRARCHYCDKFGLDDCQLNTIGALIFRDACSRAITHILSMVDAMGQTPPAKANDRQVGGEHYKKHGKFQVWDAWFHWNLNGLQAAVLKYIVRYRDKGGIQDLQKAIHYIEKLIELEEEAARDRADRGNAETDKGH